MTDHQDLRKLLSDCKELIDANTSEALVLGQSSDWEYLRALSGRISAALAEPVEPVTEQDRVDAERYRALRKKDFEEAKNHHLNFTGYPLERSEHDYNKEYDLIADREKSAK